MVPLPPDPSRLATLLLRGPFYFLAGQKWAWGQAVNSFQAGLSFQPTFSPFYSPTSLPSEGLVCKEGGNTGG